MDGQEKEKSFSAGESKSSVAETSIINDDGANMASREVSASTIGRMMGLAGASDLKLLEGKVELMSTRVANLTSRMEKVLQALNNMPTGADLERIDVQIGALRTLLKEGLAGQLTDKSKEDGKEKSMKNARIMTNADQVSGKQEEEA